MLSDIQTEELGKIRCFDESIFWMLPKCASVHNYLSRNNLFQMAVYSAKTNNGGLCAKSTNLNHAKHYYKI